MASPHAAIKAGNVAVITGAALGGIGYSIAYLLLSRYQMKVVLADIASLSDSTESLIKSGIPEAQFLTHETDVSDFKSVQELADVAFKEFGKVDFLCLNAGFSTATKDWSDENPEENLEKFNKIMAINFFGVLHGTQAFVPRMVAQSSPAAIVITGSKQGITQPPGNPAYNVSKSAVKSLAESLAHSLLETSVTAHLLIPGYTFTKLTTRGEGPPKVEDKPAAAWTADQVAEELFARIGNEFYIICPDNDVTWKLDAARIEWNMQDILHKRPALSRWNPEYKTQFENFVAEKTGKQ